MLGAKVKPIDVIDITEEGVAMKWGSRLWENCRIELTSTRRQTTSREKKKRRIESDDEDECVFTPYPLWLITLLMHV
jgi:hypothetical protein